MKKIYACHSLVRVLSVLVLFVIPAIRLVLPGAKDPATDIVFDAIVVSCVVLGMYPDGMQNVLYSFVFASVTVLLSVVSGFAGHSSAVAVVLLLVYLTCVNFGPLSKFRIRFDNASVWSLFENFASAFYICAFLSFSCLYQLSSLKFVKIVLLSLMFALYMLKYFSAYTGWTMLVSRTRECSIKKSINGFLRGIPVSDMPEEKKLTLIYERAVQLMESAKPFLNPDYGINDLAAAIYSNKTYLSRSINYYSGKNFKQFLNNYRVKHSLELMRKNPAMTVTELAYGSGFHSTVSYNLAFKLVMNSTPSCYCREVVIAKRLSKSAGRK